MFDDLDKQNAQNTNPPTPLVKGGEETVKPTEDIFADVEQPAKPEVFRSRPAGGTVIPADDGWLKNKKLIFGSLAGMFVVLVGVYFGLMMMKNKTQSQGAITQQPANPANNEVKSPAVVQPAAPPAVVQSIDSDHDGLTDQEEARLGTNPNDPDSDHDGLTDREEVKVYHTDPLNPDTDGDGYTDGTEIKNGYDPKGPGKLLEIKP